MMNSKTWRYLNMAEDKKRKYKKKRKKYER